jgi:glutathione S-transferase
MLKLYNFDSAVCAQKVRMVLSEKELSWECHNIDLTNNEQNDPDYLALNPNAVVPTLVHNENIVVESSVINEYLDETFPEIPMRPDDAYGKALMRIWTKQVDEILHPSIAVVSFSIGIRARYLAMSQEKIQERLSKIPDPARFKRIKDAIEMGSDSPAFTEAILRMAKLIKSTNSALADGRPWLLGDQITLADTNSLSFYHRLEQLGIDGMFSDYSHFNDWYLRLKARPSFKKSFLNNDEDPDNKRFWENGRKEWPKVEGIINAGNMLN